MPQFCHDTYHRQIEIYGNYAVIKKGQMEENKFDEAELRSLKQANARLQTLLHAMPDIVFFKDAEGRYQVVNKAFEESIGLKQKEIIGKTDEHFLPDELVDQCRKSDAEVLKGRKPVRMEDVVNREEGEMIFDTIKVPVYDSDGNCLGLAGLSRNITERKKAEEALRSSREFIKSILDTVDEGFIVIAKDYRIISANKAYARQIGLAIEDIIGNPCHKISHQSDKPCYELGEECAVRRSFEKGEPFTSVHRHKDKDGNIIYVETKSYPLRDSLGDVSSVIEVINNITDRHLLEEQLLRTQKLEAVGLLAGGIAHDFNNLLQGVFGNISLAKHLSDNDGKAYQMMVEAERALVQSRNLTKQLLTFPRGGEPVKKIISLPSIIQDSVKFALSGSNVNCSFSMDDDLWPVEADEGQINQVMHNIVLNAGEAMPEGGTVEISAGNVFIDKKSSSSLKKGKYIRISIKDSGIGISDNHISKIFDPYFTTKQKGSGLGLTTSFSIIKKHDGMLDVTSKPGAGSTFFVYLPACGTEQTRVREEGKDILAGAGKILVMDDEEIVTIVVGHMLGALGYEFDCVESGEEALEKYAEAMKSGEAFDAVILDLTVRGGMGGKEAIAKLLETDPAVKAIVSSGYSDDPIVANYRDFGFKAVLSKPYEIEKLSSVLYSLIAAPF